jgi:glycosyltransferase involved in cell wall biosynthesis
MSRGDFSVLHLDGGRRWGGGQNQVRLLMRELRARGVRQLCLAPRGSPLAARLREEGLPVHGIPWRGAFDPRAITAVARVIRGFALVHCHDAHALQVALLPARLTGTRVVASRRVIFPTSALKWNRADRVIAVSETVRRALLRSGVHARRIRRIYSGVDAAEVAALPGLSPPLRQRLTLGAGDFLIGNIGHLDPCKGQDVIPRAAARLPGTHWVIVGEGPRRAALESAARALEVAGRVHLTGFIPDARRVLRELDLFVFCSNEEALGTSVLDAMAQGVPVVAADATGVAEVLGPVHEETGATLYTPGDEAELARRVRAVQENPGLRAAMLAAQRRRLEAFLVTMTAEHTLAVYQELMTPGRGEGGVE